MKIAKTNTRGMSVEEVRAIQKDCRYMASVCYDRMAAVKLDMNSLSHKSITERHIWFERGRANGREANRLYKLMRRRDNAHSRKFEQRHGLVV